MYFTPEEERRIGLRADLDQRQAMLNDAMKHLDLSDARLRRADSPTAILRFMVLSTVLVCSAVVALSLWNPTVGVLSALALPFLAGGLFVAWRVRLVSDATKHATEARRLTRQAGAGLPPAGE